jgi:hypothetical protein
MPSSDQIGYVNLRAEQGQLRRADEGQDQPHQQADQGDGRQGRGTTFLNLQP